MQEGAWGLVTRFESGGPEHPDEVLEMARTVARYGGNYTSHIGSEGFEQTQGDRLCDPRRRGSEDSGPHLPLQDSRQGELGARSAATSSRSKTRARAAWTSPPTSIRTRRCSTAGARSFPCGCARAARDKFAERLKDPAARARLKKDKDFVTWAKEHGWWEGIVLARARTEKNRQYEGKRIAQIAKLRGEADPMDTCIDAHGGRGRQHQRHLPHDVGR